MTYFNKAIINSNLCVRCVPTLITTAKYGKHVTSTKTCNIAGNFNVVKNYPNTVTFSVPCN